MNIKKYFAPLALAVMALTMASTSAAGLDAPRLEAEVVGDDVRMSWTADEACAYGFTGHTVTVFDFNDYSIDNVSRVLCGESSYLLEDLEPGRYALRVMPYVDEYGPVLYGASSNWEIVSVKKQHSRR